MIPGFERLSDGAIRCTRCRRMVCSGDEAPAFKADVEQSLMEGHDLLHTPVEPPAPSRALTQEDRERLVQLADLIGGVHADGPLVDSRLHEDDARFLHKLASSPSPVPTSSQVGDEAVEAAYQSLDGEPLKWLASSIAGRKALARAAVEAAASAIEAGAVGRLTSDEGLAAMLDLLGQRGWYTVSPSEAGEEIDMTVVVGNAKEALRDAIQGAIDHAKGAKP